MGAPRRRIAVLTDTKSWIMTSAVSNHTHQISVALPDGYTKDHPVYPVLHSADANAEFGTVVETARLASFSKETTTREASVADATGEATSFKQHYRKVRWFWPDGAS